MPGTESGKGLEPITFVREPVYINVRNGAGNSDHATNATPSIFWLWMTAESCFYF